MTTAAFVHAIAVLFPIINPIGGAVLFDRLSRNVSGHDRAVLAQRIGWNVGIVLPTVTWAGAVSLEFLGLSLGAIRVAGGVLVSIEATRILSGAWTGDAPSHPMKEVQDVRWISLVPLTIPFTIGPGTIAAAIAMGALHPTDGESLLGYVLGITLAEIVMAALVAALYASAARLVRLVGATTAGAIANVSSFLLLCIGVQAMVQGLHDLWLQGGPIVNLKPDF